MIDPVAVANLDRLALAECYQTLSHDLSQMGEVTQADIFTGLATESFALLPDYLHNEGQGTLFTKSHHVAPAIKCDAASCRTAYDSWAMVAALEREAANKLITLLSSAKDPRARLLLLGRVRETFRRAAECRVQRRAAYHSERIGAVRASFPDVRRIQDRSDLALLASAIEKWMLRILKREGVPMETTVAAIARLDALIAGRPIPRRLRKWVDNLNTLLSAEATGKRSKHFRHLFLIAEAGRVFDYYDLVFDGADDTEVLAMAQELSFYALQRLKTLRATTLH